MRQRGGPSRIIIWMVSLGLITIVGALYGQTLRFGYVNLDDPVYVVENPAVNRGLTGDGVRWAFTTYHTGNWHPLTWISLMADTSLFGTGAAGHHAVNVLLHAANAVLLFIVMQRMTGAPWVSALVAALFAVHPLRAESVAWVSERKDVLAGLFWMLTLLAYHWYATQPSAPRHLLVLGVFATGLTAKAMLVTLPLILLLADVWPLHRLRSRWIDDPRWVRGKTPALPARSLGRLVIEKAPLLLLAVVVSTFTVAAERFGLALRDVSRLPIPQRIANALVAYVTYIRKTIWPVDLAVFYPHPGLLHRTLTTADIGYAVAAAAILVLVTVVLLGLGRRRPAFAFGWLWYLVTLMPVVGLIQVGDQAFADRYTYIPSIGLYLIVAWGLATMIEARPRSEWICATASIAALAALSLITWFQIATWRDGLTLFSHAAAVTDDNYFAHANLGNLLRNEGRLDEAAAQFDRALAIKPDFVFARIGFGALLEQQGKLDDAAAQEERALQLDPTSVRARVNLGIVRQKQGRMDDALVLLDEAVRRDPTSALAQANLGTVLLSLQRPAEAIPHLQQATRLDAGVAEHYNNLGVALFREHRFTDAATAFAHALQLRPDYANAQKGLAQTRQRLGTP